MRRIGAFCAGVKVGRQLAFLVGMGVFEAEREVVFTRVTEVLTAAKPSILTMLGAVTFYASNIAVMQGVMRLVAGPAVSDRLARTKRDPSSPLVRLPL